MRISRTVIILISLATIALLILIFDLTGFYSESTPNTLSVEDSISFSKQEIADDSTLHHIKKPTQDTSTSRLETDHFVNDSLYSWSTPQGGWVSTRLVTSLDTLIHKKSITSSLHEPIHVKWKTLSEITYRMRYFKKKQANMYSPIFNDELKALHNKEVIIEGFVIPYDEEGELVALSATTYTSCYFCGNASPATVISMHMKNKDDRFGLDDYKKFRGKLLLNYDDPDQFYYILNNAEAI